MFSLSSSATGQPAGFHLIGAATTSAITDSGGVAGMFVADTIVTYVHYCIVGDYLLYIAPRPAIHGECHGSVGVT